MNIIKIILLNLLIISFSYASTFEELSSKLSDKSFKVKEEVLNELIVNYKEEDKLEENSANNSTNTENDNSPNEKESSQNNSHKELKIEQFEYDYILENANFLGDTPRTIKRFINIYRIIRSHDYILNDLLEEFGEQYKFIIMILCLNDKYDKNCDDNDKLTIDNYIQKLKDLKFDVNNINDLEKFEKKDELSYKDLNYIFFYL